MQKFHLNCRALVSCILILCMLAGTVSVGAEQWDGFVSGDGDEASQYVTILDMNKISNITAITNMVPSTKVKSDTLYTGRWTDHESKKYLDINVPRDWSGFETLEMPIYSEKATNATIAVVILCDHVPTPGTSSSYWVTKFVVDWSGWKTLRLELGVLNKHNLADYSKVNKLRISASSYGGTADPETDLYFSSIVAKVSEDATEEYKISGYSETQKQAFHTAMGDNTAIYNFSPNMYTGRTIRVMDQEHPTAQTTTLDGVVMTPSAVFTDGLGAELTGDDDSWTLTLNGRTLRFKEGETGYTLDGTAGSFPQAPYVEEEVLYLPAVSCADALGKTVAAFGMLTVMGDDTTIAKLQANPYLAKVGGYMIASSPIDSSLITHEVLQEIKDRWRRELVGDEYNDMTNKYVARKIKNINNSGQAAWDSMNKSEDAEVLFGTTPVKTSNQMGSQYLYLRRMALAYAAPGADLYKNKKLKQDIFYALDWLYEHYYGQDEIDGVGWRDVHDHDWWDWFINVPSSLEDILVLLEGEYDPALISKYMSVFHYVRTFMQTERYTYNGAQSRIETVFNDALLEENVDLMKSSLEDLVVLLQFTNNGVGVYEDDYSYITHTYYALFGMYGTGGLLERNVHKASLLAGTPLEVNSELKYQQALWIYNIFEPIVYNGYMMAMYNGRNPERGTTYGMYVVEGALRLLGVFSKDDDERLKEIIRRNVGPENLDAVANYLSFDTLPKLFEVLEEENAPEPQPREYGHVYFNADRIVQNRPGYSVGLGMCSSRVANYESINNCNLTGWYQGDGWLEVYNSDSFTDPQGSNYFKYANPYHLPGTTVDTQERLPASYKDGFRPNRNFVGGVEMDEKYVTAVMDFEAFHNDVPPVNLGGVGEVGKNWDVHNNDLTAKKSWFMFDDEVVALGADIQSTTGFEVQTVLDNRLLTGSTLPANQSQEGNTIVKYEVAAVTAKGNDGNVEQNVIDDDFDTRWSYEEKKDAWLILELTEPQPIGYVGIAQFGGTGGKQAIFKLELSEDGGNWTQVFDGMASGTTEALEAYDCKGITAKYIRYVGAGRNNSTWNSVTEIGVYAPREDGQMLLPGAAGADGRIYGLEDITVDGTVLEKTAAGIDARFENPKWAHVEGFGSYYLPQGGKLFMTKPNNDKPYLEMWLSHGENPQGATYAYAILPNLTAEETAAYAANPDFTVLANNAQVQAVQDKSTGITSIVFWEAGSFNGLTANAPMAVMVKETLEDYQVSVSDPSQTLGVSADSVLNDSACDADMNLTGYNATLTIQEVLTPVSADPQIRVQHGKNETQLKINFEKSGKTRTASFKK